MARGSNPLPSSRTKYRPSNGTEGMMFMEQWCFRCFKDSESLPCEILANTFVLDVDDPRYPKEWTWVPVDMSTPSCSAFITPEDAAKATEAHHASVSKILGGASFVCGVCQKTVGMRMESGPVGSRIKA